MGVTGEGASMAADLHSVVTPERRFKRRWLKAVAAGNKLQPV